MLADTGAAVTVVLDKAKTGMKLMEELVDKKLMGVQGTPLELHQEHSYGRAW